jgi:hypothetical protein
VQVRDERLELVACCEPTGGGTQVGRGERDGVGFLYPAGVSADAYRFGFPGLLSHRR